MLRKIILLIIFAFIFLIPSKIYAVENPLAVPNNIYGIHILDENDLKDAARLVNSSGGDWGYVTVVIRSDERDHKRWQNAFDEMRRLHLIPIVRIATKQTPQGWEKPNFDEIDGWIGFLNSLNWVIKNRYVVIGNEPNHAKEWGGEVKPEEYANYLKTISQRLKTTSSDFFIMPAGFDASAPNSKISMSEDNYLENMLSLQPDAFNNVDGWASHSYPNPNFSGSQDAIGKGSVKTYIWELNYLKNLGVTKNLPVFITETGWKHDAGNANNQNSILAAQKFKSALEIAWKDEQIVAVTPFILNYKEPPFDVFSWKKPDGSFYEIYDEVSLLPKIKGAPNQISAVDILSIVFPPVIPGNGKLSGVVLIRNTGQQIWEGRETIYAENRGREVTLQPIVPTTDIEPEHNSMAVVKIKIKE